VVVNHGLGHDLDGALPAHLHVFAQVHRAHAAFAQLLDDVVPVGNHAADQVATRRRPERGTVVGAELGVVRPLGAARRAGLHGISTRINLSPTSNREPFRS